MLINTYKLGFNLNVGSYHNYNLNEAFIDQETEDNGIMTYKYEEVLKDKRVE